MEFVVTVAPGLAPMLENELEALGIVDRTPAPRAVRYSGDLASAYRVCMWSRVASRVLLKLGSFRAEDGDSLYEGACEIDWLEHIDPRCTFAVDADGKADGLTHTQYVALRVKDAIVDTIRKHKGERPSVDTKGPDIRIHVFLRAGMATVSLDLSGDRLHRRGYRKGLRTAAPIQETLAAAMALSALADKKREQSSPNALIVDPMCGSGTLAIEAALIATDTAPGLLRRRFGFSQWPGHDLQAWKAIVAEAEARDRRTKLSDGRTQPLVWGFDESSAALRVAETAVRKAGLTGIVRLQRCAIADLTSPVSGDSSGVLLVNPPYGERLGDAIALQPLYRQLGMMLREQFGGWTAWIISADADLTRGLGLKATRRMTVYNGGLQCRLLCYPLTNPRADHAEESSANRSAPKRTITRSAEAQAFANRLQKNAKMLGRWARREGITCYRLYDADIPQYAAAIDRYGDYVHVQEYAPPPEIAPKQAAARLHDIVALTAEVLTVPAQNIFVKVRRQQRGKTQYEKIGSHGNTTIVHEGGHRFAVNLSDYLDTGLFIDQRSTRAMLQQLAKGKNFLNLFCYTATASVYAAAGGAKSTTSVDMSATYLQWAAENFSLNRIGTTAKHQLVRADCLEWLKQPAQKRKRFDLVYVDPPTFSASKRMQTAFDIQRDHAALLRGVMQLMSPGGILLFSTHRRGFKFDTDELAACEHSDITREILPKDFSKNKGKLHVWRLVNPRRD